MTFHSICALRLPSLIVSELHNKKALEQLPLDQMNSQEFYDNVHGTNCECVIGYVPLPVVR
jgi:hydroxymethylglutaryl-CoA reductase